MDAFGLQVRCWLGIFGQFHKFVKLVVCVSTRSFKNKQLSINQRVVVVNCVNISLPLDKRLFVLYLCGVKTKRL